jgi:hypothetical protein
VCCWCALLALPGLTASSSFATTVLAPSFERLVDRAELIFTGQVTSQHSEWKNQNGQRSIVTFVSFRVDAIHKGNAGSMLTLQFLGGTVGDVTLDVSEMPRFRDGERVVLFVSGNGEAASPVVGFYHGKFSLRQDASGREIMLKHNGQPLADIAEVGQATSKNTLQGALSHEEFTRRVRERVTRARE